MMLPKGRLAKPYTISEVRALTKEDLSLLRAPRATPNRIEKFRESHHRVAMLFAMGYKVHEIATITGYSTSRIASLRKTPAFSDLVEQKRDRVEAADVTDMIEDRHSLMQLQRASVRHLLDWYHDLDETGEIAPPRVSLAIAADMSDRVGFGKHSSQTTYDGNFAERLEKAVKQSNKVLEARVVPGPQPTTVPAARLPSIGRGGSSTMADPLSLKRRA